MKRKIIFILMLNIFLTACGNINVSKEIMSTKSNEINIEKSTEDISLPQIQNKEETNKNIEMLSYNDFIKKISNYIINNDINSLYDIEGMIGIMQLKTDELLNSMGYTLIDINDDNILELIIAITNEEINNKMYGADILCIYTYKNNEIICLFEGYEKNTYHLIENNKIYNIEKSQNTCILNLYYLPNNFNELLYEEKWHLIMEEDNEKVYYTNYLEFSDEKDIITIKKTLDDFLTAQKNYNNKIINLKLNSFQYN